MKRTILKVKVGKKLKDLLIEESITHIDISDRIIIIDEHCFMIAVKEDYAHLACAKNYKILNSVVI